MPQGSTCHPAGTLVSDLKQGPRKFDSHPPTDRKGETKMIAIPTPKDAQQARRLADVAARADDLLTKQGYTAYLTANPGVWGIYSPAGKAYTVNLTTVTCTCPDFQNPEHGDYCKHLYALSLQLDREEAEVNSLFGDRENDEGAESSNDGGIRW
jgi:predicted nucleic acid-binding Zn finger protein